ncbi:Reverse transcriptase (RNA-dependent DNA polymerase), partial [bacterium]|nr:Reverse transcriptase (RNA-dependent DNA polymerase) [bacterium]
MRSNLLYDSFLASLKGSAWKEEPQRFEIDFLTEIVKLKKEIESREYRTSPGSEFTLNERGKIRHIHGARIRDRVVRHALCD